MGNKKSAVQTGRLDHDANSDCNRNPVSVSEYEKWWAARQRAIVAPKPESAIFRYFP